MNDGDGGSVGPVHAVAGAGEGAAAALRVQSGGRGNMTAPVTYIHAYEYV